MGIWGCGPAPQGKQEERSTGMSHRSQPFDRRPADGSGLDDLDLAYFKSNYLPAAVDADVLRHNQRTVQERLESLRLLSGYLPTYGAILVLGKDPRSFVPGAYLVFLRIDGTELGDPIKDDHDLSGPLYEVVHRLDGLLKLNVSTAVDIAGGATESRVRDYPLAALQQLARNALIHRNYETSNAPVRIYWFDDRVEIHNPGGPFGQVTLDNFGSGATDYRNPLVAEAMANLGYVQRFGYGIPLSRRLLRDNGNPPPEFSLSQSATLVTVRRRS
ncbi:MAG: hypothetical protein GXP62_16840 [Oligoflexia bacterium]|nr:hypothetical protein [Oligoflexia bacterium]